MKDKNWNHFLELCLKIKDPLLLKEFFEFFMTHEEIEMLSARYGITKALIEKKLTQREISKEHKVSIAQTTRGSNALKSISPELKNFLYHHLDVK